MFTEPYTFTHMVDGRERRIEIDGGLLKCWWSAFDGPQTAERLVAANMHIIDVLIAEKCPARGSDNVIRLTSVDYESELD